MTSLQKYNITEDRIVYIKVKGNFTGESPDIYETFLTKNKVPKNVLILQRVQERIEEYYKFELDVEAPLRLMQLIACETVENSKGYFQRNLLKVTKASIDGIIGA